EQQIFLDEAKHVNAPIPFVTLNTVGPALMAHGSDAHKAQFLSTILKGEVHFAIGYTEPGAGTDLASLTTRAVRDGDEFIINGNKIFTTSAEEADYIWLAVRTDPDAPRHKGISILIVDTRDPGFSCAPIHILDGHKTFTSHYDNVRVHESMVVGEVNGGWKLITTQLNHERMGLGAMALEGLRSIDEVIRYASEPRGPGEERLIDLPWVRNNLAEAQALLAAMKVMNWRMAWEADRGPLMPAPASSVKVFCSENNIRVHQLLLEVLGAEGLLQAGSEGAVLRGKLEKGYKSITVMTFGGGVNEIQRELIAMFGLDMPRPMR
ncbi:MAG: acyl-CoA dehydrogenase, partial [Halieaceae bacterium]|nr:acyl-CoA dehydrogenase [Halieaceae bacterium]